MSSSNRTRDVTINNPELGALLMQILIFAPRMALLAHIHTYINNTKAQGWANRGSVSIASSVGKIMWDLSLAARRQQIHAYVGHVSGEDNKMADAASQLTHLPDRQFISHFRTHFAQSKPWRLIPLPFECRRKLTTILYNKQSPRVPLQPSSRKTAPLEANGGTSAAGCKPPLTSRTINTPFLSSIFLQARPCQPSVCARENYQEAIYR